MIDGGGRLFSFAVSADITRITPQLLAENGARPFREVWPRFTSWLAAVAAEGSGGGGGGDDDDEVGGGVVLAAHKANFDRNFLAKEVARAKLDRCVRTFSYPLAVLEKEN